MNKKTAFALCAGLLLARPALAVTYEDVDVPDSVVLAGQEVPLNGVGLREVVWVNIYVGALYLPKKTTTPEQALAQDGPRRIALYFVHDVDAEDVLEAWIEGFENNNAELMQIIGERIATFNSFFGDLVKGDTVFMDYLPGQGTQVTINNAVKGMIPGQDFSDALLRIWLGRKPPGGNLKEGMLGDY
ncbi:MAG: chalcone isomerase family protein [Nitrococcus mobilis]|nr:chalcone isomerase family protein [Nitrococcus mobilis]